MTFPIEPFITEPGTAPAGAIAHGLKAQPGSGTSRTQPQVSLRPG